MKKKVEKGAKKKVGVFTSEMTLLDLKGLVRVLDAKLNELIAKNEVSQDEHPEMMTREYVAALLNVSVQSVDKYAKDGILTKIKDAHVIRFAKSEVLNVFKNYSKYQRTVKKTQINDESI